MMPNNPYFGSFNPSLYYPFSFHQPSYYPVYSPPNFEMQKEIQKNLSESPQIKLQQKESEPPKTQKIRKSFKFTQENKKYLSGKVCGRQFQKKRADEDFKQRKQTQNRNLSSNTLKMYLKQVREPNTQTYRSLKKIINYYNYDYEVDIFLSELNQKIPITKSYISFQNLKPLLQKEVFGKILRISLRYFYLKQIYCIGHHSVRTTKKLRLQQLKRGREFLKALKYFQA